MSVSFVIHFVIILLFTAILVINITQLSTFYYSKFITITAHIKSNAPRYESLYTTYCGNSKYSINNLEINTNILLNFIIFFILFIIFHFTYINALISYNFKKFHIMSSEIKLLGYDKYFNKSIKSKSEYSIVSWLWYYILLMFIYYLVIIIISYIEYNINEREIEKNMKSIDEIVKQNMKCELYNSIIHKEEYHQNIEILSKYIKRNENRINQLTDKDKIVEVVKILFTYEVSTGASFYHNNKKLSLKNKDTTDICDDATKCFFISLSNTNTNEIFSDFDILESRDVISLLVNYDQKIMNKLKTEYLILKSNIESNSANITKNKDYYNTYYKAHLIGISFPSVYFSMSAIIFFGLFEFNGINKFFNSYYLNIDSLYIIYPFLYNIYKFIILLLVLGCISIIIL